MTISRKAERSAAAAVLATVLLLGAVWSVGPGVVRAAYEGRSYGLLNQLVSGQSRYSADDYVLFFRHTIAALAVALMVTAAATTGALVWMRRQQYGVSRRAAGIGLALLTVTLLVTRLPFVNEALERDLMVYMTVAAGLLEGRPLYAEMWDHKPPAIHATYAAAAALFGATPLALFVLGVLAAALTLYGCYVAGRYVGGTPGGLVAAAVWTLVSGDLLLQANQPNVEVFMNVCLVWAFALVLGAPEHGLSWRYVASGFLYFLATLYKPVVATTACAVVGAAVALSMLATSDGANRSARFGTMLRNAAAAGAAAAGAWALVLAYFWSVGRFDPFFEAVVEYNRDYAGDVGGNVLASLLPSIDSLWSLVPYVPTLVAIGLIATVALRGHARRPWGLLLAYLAASWVAIALPGRLYPHYFQLLLPPLAIGIGWAVSAAAARRSSAAMAACGLLVFCPVAARAYQGFVPLSQVPVFKYGGYGYDCLETQRMATWINGNFSSSAVVYHWGPDPGVYFYAGRSSPVGFVFNLPLLDDNERGRRYSAKVLAELQQRRPDLIVVRGLELRVIDNPIEVWIQDHYSPIVGPDNVERYVFLTPRETLRTVALDRSTHAGIHASHRTVDSP